MKKIYFALLFSISTCCYSQDLRSGDITFSNFSGNNYEINVTIYSQISTAIPHSHFFMNYGDGTTDSIAVSPPSVLGNNIYEYSFFLYHNFPGDGFWNFSLQGDFLVDSVANLTNSASKPFYLEAGLLINSAFNSDHSPSFTQQQQFYFPCCNTIVQSTNGYDADGDSLSYSLVALDSGYSYSGATIDAVTGNLTFTPPQAGRYLFDIKVDEWKNYSSSFNDVGYVVRQVLWYVGDETGIEELTGNDDVQIFPTLVQDALTIKSTKGLQDVRITIADMQGRTVFPSRLLSHINEETLHLGFLVPGAYLVKAESGDGVFVRKILKM